MTIPDELPFVLRALERSGLAYVLTGSLASVIWGKPRATYDADFVIDLPSASVDQFLSAFPQPDWYYDRDAAFEAIRIRGEFNLIHGATGTKVDVWIKKNRAFDAVSFTRRRREAVQNVDCWVLSPEDTILAKLEWMRQAPSDRQLADVAGVLAVQKGKLDMAYLQDWADRLSVADLFEVAQKAADTSG